MNGYTEIFNGFDLELIIYDQILFHNVLMGVEWYNLHQIKDNFIIFQSYIDIFELKSARNGGKSV